MKAYFGDLRTLSLLRSVWHELYLMLLLSLLVACSLPVHLLLVLVFEYVHIVYEYR